MVSPFDLLQRHDRLQRLPVPRELPVLLELRLVDRVPFRNVSECPTRKPARDEPVPDAHRNLVLAVRRVKMRWFVIAVEDAITIPRKRLISGMHSLYREQQRTPSPHNTQDQLPDRLGRR